ncbi:ATP-binding protein [Nostoc sp. WHI]|uniref:ATP-binding protein n=1 Tax=Nostoc sp. WHI TaxID=2650611 RepID=UPI001E286A66|nr:ATP-binding protein [Nostoc sp. WHI]
MMELLTVPDSLNSLKAIADYVMAAAAAAGLNKKASYKLRLAVDEIATNIIVYGYKEAGHSGVLDLQAEFNEQTLTISMEDTGVPYDSSQTEIPNDLNQPLEQRHIGGLGVYLAIHGVDKFIYERVGNRNRNIFVVNRTRITQAVIS